MTVGALEPLDDVGMMRVWHGLSYPRRRIAPIPHGG
jgi:hypothetical protein